MLWVIGGLRHPPRPDLQPIDLDVDLVMLLQLVAVGLSLEVSLAGTPLVRLRHEPKHRTERNPRLTLALADPWGSFRLHLTSRGNPADPCKAPWLCAPTSRRVRPFAWGNIGGMAYHLKAGPRSLDECSMPAGSRSLLRSRVVPLVKLVVDAERPLIWFQHPGRTHSRGGRVRP